jgi:hypothetical protein
MGLVIAFLVLVLPILRQRRRNTDQAS